MGVHSPEFSYEADVDNIIEASADLGVIWPIALDTDKRNFHRWQEARTLGLMLVYMAGALLPALLLAVLIHAVPSAKRFLDRLPVVAVGAAVGAAYAITLATGRYDDLIGELYRITTNA